MTVTETGPTCGPSETGNAVADALRTQQTFTREQVAWLMSEAMRWGYELRDEEDTGFRAGYNARVDEENAAYPPPKVFALGKWYDQPGERAEADAAARLPRPGDFRGRDTPSRRAAA